MENAMSGMGMGGGMPSMPGAGMPKMSRGSNCMKKKQKRKKNKH